MRPDPIRVEETTAWLEKSRKDLWRAENVLTLDPPDTEDCLFHCQQAVEKSLKAFLVWRDHPFRKTHDLVELTRQCVDLEPTLADVLRGVGGLTRFAWEYRYPGEAETPELEFAHRWLLKVKEVLGAIEGLLPPPTSPAR
ncbi:MAG: HEPN domain-containing protein [Acidobacteria bacterium]|nr:HEPN domain-containing protein [Acidobacteriota bacterium]